MLVDLACRLPTTWASVVDPCTVWQDMNKDLVNRLRGIYIIPVNDGAGLLDGKDTYTRTFHAPQLQHDAANEIERLYARIVELEAVLQDIADHGLRFDLNPTHKIDTRDSSEMFWHAYAKRMDDSIRERAKDALGGS